MPSSKGSSQNRDQTWVSRIAGGFFTSEPLKLKCHLKRGSEQDLGESLRWGVCSGHTCGPGNQVFFFSLVPWPSRRVCPAGSPAHTHTHTHTLGHGYIFQIKLLTAAFLLSYYAVSLYLSELWPLSVWIRKTKCCPVKGCYKTDF